MSFCCKYTATPKHCAYAFTARMPDNMVMYHRLDRGQLRGFVGSLGVNWTSRSFVLLFSCKKGRSKTMTTSSLLCNGHNTNEAQTMCYEVEKLTSSSVRGYHRLLHHSDQCQGCPWWASEQTGQDDPTPALSCQLIYTRHQREYAHCGACASMSTRVLRPSICVLE